MSEKQENRIYKFDEFCLDTNEHLLIYRGERILLSPRIFSLLVILVENAGHLLEKETLIKEIWGDTIVEDGNLNRTISNLRRALGEKPDENRFIETIPRVGYRFVAPVEIIDGAANAEKEKRNPEIDNGNRTKGRGQKLSWFFPILAFSLFFTLAFGFFAWRNRQKKVSELKPNETTSYEPVRLTDNPKHDSNPQWTKDGRLRFLRISSDGSTESWIMNADGTDQKRIEDFPGLQFGVWSPDNSKVCFAKPNDKSAFYLTNADGSNEVALPFFGGNFDWSPDSKRIVYQKLIDANSEIFVYSLETGENRNVTNDPGFDADPTFSPDGKQIAFASLRDGNAEIYLMDADGGNVRRLTDHPAWDNHPVFSPDGTQIAFDSDREKEQSGIYLINADGNGEAIRLVNWDKSNEWIVPGGWSPDGTRIAFSSDHNGHDDIYVVSAEIFRPERIFSDDNLNLGFPSYSPDGKYIVYQVETVDKSGELRILDLETKLSRLLIKTVKADIYPIWSPDGKWIAFQNQIEGNTEIYLIMPDKSGLKNLTNHPAKDAFPSWSPDGRQIVFTSNRDGNYELLQLYIMNADGSNQHRIYYSSAISSFPSWSPDGKGIVFSNDKEDNRSGNFEIFIIKPETADAERRLTFRRRFDTQPVFSPDGKYISFVSNADGNSEIYLMDTDGTRLLRLTRNVAEDNSPHWSPDGKNIIFSSNREGKFAIYEIKIP